MNLSDALRNRKLEQHIYDLNDELWDLFHKGEINNDDDFYEAFLTYLDNAVIYYSDCNEILEGNMEYCFEEHEVYGRPENQVQAAYNCLYDYVQNHDDLVKWNEMEEVLNN